MTGRNSMSENMTEITEDYHYPLVNPKNTIQVLKKYDIHLLDFKDSVVNEFK